MIPFSPVSMLFSYDLYGLTSSGFDPQRTFVTSLLISPLALASVRALIAVYCFTTMIVCYTWLSSHLTVMTLRDVNISPYFLVTDSHGIGQSFSFFTYLTFWSLGFYFALTSIHGFCYAFRQRTWLHDKWPKSLQLLHSFYYTTVTTFPFLVSIVFWGTMYSGPWPAHRFEQWINLSVHGLNSLFALVEIVFAAAHPPPWTHMSVLFVVLTLYLVVAYLTRVSEGFYVYEWMNPAHGWASIIVHVICYAAGIAAIFVIVRYAIWGRNKLLVRSTEETQGGMDANKEMMRLGDGSVVDLRRQKAPRVHVTAAETV